MWSVHLVKCSELIYFVRGFPPCKATPGVVLVDTSPTPDLDIAMIRQKRPGDVWKEEKRPWSLRRTPSWKAKLDWTLFKSGRVICKTIEHVIITSRNNGWTWKFLARNPNKLKYLLFDCSQEQKNMLAADKRKRLTDKTDRSPKTKALRY